MTTPQSQLLDHAERLFSQQGYIATTVDDIATAANADILFDKDDLLWASAVKIATAFESALDTALKEERPLDDLLRYAMIAHIQVIVQNMHAANVYMSEWRYLSPDRRAEYLARRDAYEARFRDIIRTGVHAGMFAPVDEKFVTLMLLSGLNWISQWYRVGGAMTPQEIAETLADLTLNGLYRRV